MRKPALLEFSSITCKVLTEKIVDETTGDKILSVEVQWQHADIINGNGRKYPRKVLESEIERLTPLCEQREVWGAAFHPVDGIGETFDQSHLWTKIWMEGDGKCYGHVDILPTSIGKDIQVMARYGKIGMSSRGFGTVTVRHEDVDGKEVTYDEINEDYTMKTPGDFVMSPSVPGAGTRRLLESQLNEAEDLENTDEVKEMKFKTIEELKEAYPQFVEEIENAIRESMKADIEAKVAEQLEAKKVEWKTEVETGVQAKLDTLQAEFDTLKTKNDELLESIRKMLETGSAAPDVIEEDPDAGNTDDGSTDESKKLEQLKVELEAEKTKTAALEKEKSDLAEAETKAAADAELQVKLEAELTRIFADNTDYTIYRSIIEKRVKTEDGKIAIKAVEAVEAKVKEEFDDISNLVAEAERAKIVKDTDEKGTIENPEGKDEAKNKARLIALYKEAKRADYKGTFEEWKEEFQD